MAAKKKAKKKGKAGMTAFEFCRAYLKKKKSATFAEIRDAAAKKGLKLAPISYGRAQALEGIVKARPYGSAKKDGPKRRPGRPKGSKNKPKIAATGVDSIDSLVGTLQTLQRERDDAVAVLDKIRDLLDSM